MRLQAGDIIAITRDGKTFSRIIRGIEFDEDTGEIEIACVFIEGPSKGKASWVTGERLKKWMQDKKYSVSILK